MLDMAPRHLPMCARRKQPRISSGYGVLNWLRPAGTKVAPAGRMRTDHGQKSRARLARRIRLLLVEDELSTVFAMREFFAQAGYDVDCASGPNEATLLLDRHQYDAVITDLHLTVHRAGEGLRMAWQARRRNPKACIVMLTGFDDDTTEEEARRCGVDMYEAKPVELSHLSAFVDLALTGDRTGARTHETDVKCRQH
jgi:DNA-binding NarL/FixJ family response regulator